MKTIEFKPSFTRYLLGNLLMFSVGYALATALPGLLFPPFDARSWLIGILITVVVVGLLIPLEFAMLRKRLVVSINNQEVYTWKRKHVIALNKVDMEKKPKAQYRSDSIGALSNTSNRWSKNIHRCNYTQLARIRANS